MAHLKNQSWGEFPAKFSKLKKINLLHKCHLLMEGDVTTSPSC